MNLELWFFKDFWQMERGPSLQPPGLGSSISPSEHQGPSQPSPQIKVSLGNCESPLGWVAEACYPGEPFSSVFILRVAATPSVGFRDRAQTLVPSSCRQRQPAFIRHLLSPNIFVFLTSGFH